MTHNNSMAIFRIEDINDGLTHLLSTKVDLTVLWCLYRILLQEHHLCLFPTHWSIEIEKYRRSVDIDYLLSRIPYIEDSVCFRHLYSRISTIMRNVEDEVMGLYVTPTSLFLKVSRQSRVNQCTLSSQSVGSVPAYILRHNCSRNITI